MRKGIQSLLLGVSAAAALSGSAIATDLDITCRCVVGGVNSGTAEWIQKKIIPAFTEKMKAQGKDVTVKLTQFGGEDEQLTQQLALDFSTGAGPDVSAFDGFLIPSFVQGGLLKPLEEIAGPDVASWDGWSHIADGTKALMSYQGKPYGIALGTDARMIFVRRDLFQKAGLDADSWQPKSWGELLDAARKIKAADPDSFPLQLNAGVSMGEATTMQGYWMALLGTGEQVTDENGKYIVASQGILDTLRLYKTIYVDDKLGDQRAQLLADGRNRTFANFRDGKTAMLVEGDWFYRSVTAPGAEFTVADRDKVMTWKKMPAAQPGKGLRGQDFVTISGGTGFVINPHTDAPKESWDLLSFMNSQEQLTAFQEIQPAIRIRDDVAIPNSPFLTETAKTLLPITTARPNDANYNKVSTEIQRMTESVVSGEMSPEDAMAQYKAAIVAIVGEENTVSRL
ncbi:extracellular solute-binding protein [Rhizobium mongolense]|uniref:Multiple sugar transport system substrate-binding protein n=2 Tax=Rhizobium mongolense TaxID=57676 RepID=A0ABR6IPU8_9HYPH|nr:extracellular solute-binding protein [Rhizobium mongolense]MBB4229715.1 multiple sugar transport system substrate-binding protein [Rhizobium mongolense]TVZ73131.1 multiple sugar transport system substrate-binding protein [Rhizobium mongolense USDA 1844]